MEICLICGCYFDAFADPHHEEDCSERFTKITGLKVKTNPDLKKILETVINGKK